MTKESEPGKGSDPFKTLFEGLSTLIEDTLSEALAIAGAEVSTLRGDLVQTEMRRDDALKAVDQWTGRYYALEREMQAKLDTAEAEIKRLREHARFWHHKCPASPGQCPFEEEKP